MKQPINPITPKEPMSNKRPNHAPRYRTRSDLIVENRELQRSVEVGKQLLASCFRSKKKFETQAAARPRCYACDEFAVGARDRRPEGGKLELACARHCEGGPSAIDSGGLRRIGDVLELDRNCELGESGERGIVTEIDGPYMTLVFPNRSADHREVSTGADYAYLRNV